MPESEHPEWANAAKGRVGRRDAQDPTVALADVADLAYFEVDRERNVVAMSSALETTRYHREEAARLLGISRTTRWRKMKKYELEVCA